MAQSKKNKLVQKIVDTPFIDFDTCCICNSHNGPFVWIKIDHEPHTLCEEGIYKWESESTLYFVCEDCYEKLKEKPLG